MTVRAKEVPYSDIQNIIQWFMRIQLHCMLILAEVELGLCKQSAKNNVSLLQSMMGIWTTCVSRNRQPANFKSFRNQRELATICD